MSPVCTKSLCALKHGHTFLRTIMNACLMESTHMHKDMQHEVKWMHTHCIARRSQICPFTPGSPTPPLLLKYRAIVKQVLPNDHVHYVSTNHFMRSVCKWFSSRSQQTLITLLCNDHFNKIKTGMPLTMKLMDASIVSSSVKYAWFSLNLAKTPEWSFRRGDFIHLTWNNFIIFFLSPFSIVPWCDDDDVCLV